MAKRRTTVFFSDRQLALLSDEASKLDMSVAELLRWIVDRHTLQGYKSGNTERPEEDDQERDGEKR